MIDLQTTAAAMGIADGQKLAAELWAQSMSSLPAGPVPFLSDEFIAAACEYSQLPAAIQSELTSAGRRLDARESARAMFWHAHCLLAAEHASVDQWPDPIPALALDSGAFFLLACLSLVEITRQTHSALGIPQNIIRETMGDLLQHVEKYKVRHGAYGISARQAGQWLPLHFHGRLYRLGRLNFKLMPWSWPARAYRWIGEGISRDVDDRPLPRVIVLVGDGEEFRRDGQFNGAGGVTETAGIWTSTFSEEGDHLIGNLIDPASGAARSDSIRLATSQWRQILKQGDQLIDIHIPEIGRLDFDLCGDALAQAQEFFPKYFPDVPLPVAYFCHSWLLDPQLEKYLPASANIVRFSREFYRLPSKTGPSGMLRNMQSPPGRDPTSPPRQTTLQRSLINHVAAGGHWRNAGALLFLADFAWGRQVYCPTVPLLS